MSRIRKSDPLSIIKEELILEEFDKQGRYRKYERKFHLHLHRGEYEKAGRMERLMALVDRGWDQQADALPSDLKYSPDDMIKMYADMYPDQVKKDK